jgi:hypothetical protein
LFSWSASRGTPPNPSFLELGEITHHCHRLHIKNGSFYFFPRNSLPRRRSALPAPDHDRLRASPAAPVTVPYRSSLRGRPPAPPRVARIPLSPWSSPSRITGPRRSSPVRRCRPSLELVPVGLQRPPAPRPLVPSRLLTQKVHLAPNTQQAEQAGFARAKSKDDVPVNFS